MKAARERKSIAAVVREKLSGEKTLTDEKAKRLLQKMNALREKIAKEHKGLNLTKAVIDARYE